MTQHPPPTITLDLRSDTRFLSAYDANTGKPVATLQRRRIYDRTAPTWNIYALDGTLLLTSGPLSASFLARKIARALQQKAPTP